MLVTRFVVVLPVAAAVGVVIQNDSMWIDSLGDLHIVGEVKNTGDVWVHFVKVTGTLRDVSSGVVDVTWTYTQLQHVPSGGMAPFDMIETDTEKSARVQSYSLAVESQEIAALSQKLVVLSISDSKNALGWLEVVGEVQNQGDIPSTYTQVIGTFYDTAGKVVYVAFTFTSPDEIPAGGKCGFKLDVIGTERTYRVAHYTVTAESENSRFTSVPETTSPEILMIAALIVGVATLRRKRA
jgi:hypothetical protein